MFAALPGANHVVFARPFVGFVKGSPLEVPALENCNSGYDWIGTARGRREDMRESVRGNCDDANLVSGT